MFQLSVISLLMLALARNGAQAHMEDNHEKCQMWASSGECEVNPSYMLVNCALSCERDKIAQRDSPIEDKHEKCATWAGAGECEANPNYMLRNCRKSCPVFTEPDIPTDFYSITERDILGNIVNFSNFTGKLVYIVNVASQCGYTAENYKLLQHLSQLRSDMFEILIFPCNQFGGQEPGSADEIVYTAVQYGFGGIVMAKSDVNGGNTGPTFLYLKNRSGKEHISWNFDGKFLVDRDGSVTALTTETLLDTIKQKLLEAERLSVDDLAAEL